MNIIIGLAVCAAALLMKLYYRPEGSLSSQLLALSIGAGLITAFSLNSLTDIGGVFVMLLEAAICAGVLALYRLDCRRQADARERRRAAVRREREEAIRMAQASAAPRLRSSFAAFSEGSEKCGKIAA